jgi:broad specificity phosphatase PhoE
VSERRLILIRHGVTDWNREGRFQGQLDPPLADEGRAEAALLGERLAASADCPAAIIASPLIRASATAEVIAATIPTADRPPIVPDPRLVEVGQGEWEGRTHDELLTADAERYAAWRDGGGNGVPPGAEPIESVVARATAAIDELANAEAWPLCLVSHGGILRVIARQLLGLTPRRAWALDVDNASLSVLVADPGEDWWKVERWNDTRHLLGRMATHVAEAEGRPVAL